MNWSILCSRRTGHRFCFEGKGEGISKMTRKVSKLVLLLPVFLGVLVAPSAVAFGSAPVLQSPAAGASFEAENPPSFSVSDSSGGIGACSRAFQDRQVRYLRQGSGRW
jgi:hypothetical protein